MKAPVHHSKPKAVIQEAVPHAPGSLQAGPGGDEATCVRVGGEVGLQEPPGALLAGAGRPTDSPAFRAWFRDSKVVDAAGEPLVVYHGTKRSGFSAFQGSEDSMLQYGGPAHFFTSSAEYASQEAGVRGPAPGVLPCYLALANPLILDYRGEVWDGDSGVLSAARTGGHDGLIRLNVKSMLRGIMFDEFVAFDPRQIKSAFGNCGAFDPADPDIRA